MIETNHDLPIYEKNSSQKHWSIRQANSRLQGMGLQDALASDLSRNVQDIPLKPINEGVLKHKTYGFQDPFSAAPMEAWQEMKDYNLRVNGLPTLDQMMKLNTYSPLTQSNFAAFLKRHGGETNLSFLMALDRYDKLWRAHLVRLDRKHRQKLSQFLASAHQPTLSSSRPFQDIPDTDGLLPNKTLTPQSSSYDMQEINYSREDLLSQARDIYRTYCGPGKICLPEDHRRALEEMIEVNQRPEPIVFDSARAHVFEILNLFYYPLFVDEVLDRNLSGRWFYLILGALLLTLGFSLEFSFIFLEVLKGLRWVSIIPFFLGWSFLLSGLTEFSWFFGLISISEIKFMDYLEVQDINVKKVHQKRGLIWLSFTLILSVISTIIFVFIPSHRL